MTLQCRPQLYLPVYGVRGRQYPPTPARGPGKPPPLPDMARERPNRVSTIPHGGLARSVAPFFFLACAVLDSSRRRPRSIEGSAAHNHAHTVAFIDFAFKTIVQTQCYAGRYKFRLRKAKLNVYRIACQHFIHQRFLHRGGGHWTARFFNMGKVIPTTVTRLGCAVSPNMHIWGSAGECGFGFCSTIFLALSVSPRCALIIT